MYGIIALPSLSAVLTKLKFTLHFVCAAENDAI